MASSHRPERLILKIPKPLWLLRSSALAFCMTKKRTIIFFISSVIYGIFLLAFHHYFPTPLPLKILNYVIWAAIFSFFTLLILPTVFIRKDCFECQLGFHILAHERNHLFFRESNEIIIEERTLKQTADQLVPILLFSDSEICKDCLFLWRKMYCQATFNYLKGEPKESTDVHPKFDNALGLHPRLE